MKLRSQGLSKKVKSGQRDFGPDIEKGQTSNNRKIDDHKNNLDDLSKIRKSRSKHLLNDGSRVIINLSQISNHLEQKFPSSCGIKRKSEILTPDNGIRRSKRIKKKVSYDEEQDHSNKHLDNSCLLRLRLRESQNTSKKRNILPQPKEEKIMIKVSKNIGEVKENPISINSDEQTKSISNTTNLEALYEVLTLEINNSKSNLSFNDFTAKNFDYEFKALNVDSKCRKLFLDSNSEKNESRIPSMDCKFPLPFNQSIKKTNANQNDFSDFEEVYIIDNSNKKLMIKVPKYFQSTKSIAKIPNPFNKDDRNDFFNSCSFNQDYKAGYAPIQMQENEEKNLNEKNHFIRKKQSSANVSLKRTSGVSYVKETESKQINVSDIYKPLSPLVFQCSTGCEILEQHFKKMKELSQKLLLNDCWALATYFECDEEDIMRNYIMNKEDRLDISNRKYFFIKSFTDLWPLFQDKFFICLHFKFDSLQLIQSFPEWHCQTFSNTKITKASIHQFIHCSDILIGVLVRKSISGKKAFSKSIFEGFQISDFLPNKTGIPKLSSPISTNQSTPNPTPISVHQQKVLKRNFPENDRKEILFDERSFPISNKLFSNETFSSLPCFKKIVSSISDYFFNNFKSADKLEIEENTNNMKDLKKEADSEDDIQIIHSDSSSINKDSVNPEFIFHERKMEYIKKLWKDPGKTVNTLSLRYEFYVEKAKWENCSKECKDLISTFAQVSKDELENYIVEMIEKRDNAKDHSSNFNEAFKKFNVFTFENNFDIPMDIEENWKVNFPISLNYYLSEKPKERCNIKASILSLTKEGSPLDFPKIYPSSFTMPLYFISIRDCFAFDLVEKVSHLNINGKIVVKREFFFHPDAIPQNFSHFRKLFPDLSVGVTTYENFFSHEELKEIEEDTHQTELKCFDGHFLPMTCQTTCTTEKVRRTKFFFGVRYMWSKLQLTEPHSFIGAGVRKDVSPPPHWMKSKVEYPLVRAKIIDENFINSITMNIYHDGKEGLAQHFDDAVRFKQPIFTLRLFSDCRLSFGSQLYGFCNGAFTIPLPRGCVCVMHEGSYSANGIKHCIRPCDMSGKSAAIILRQIHQNVLNEAEIYEKQVDFPTAFSTLSMNEESISYNDQKRYEAEQLLGNCK